MYKRTLLIIFCFVKVFAYAQSFWIEPDKGYYTGKDSALISFFKAADFSMKTFDLNQLSIKSIVYCNGFEQKKLVLRDTVVAGFLLPLTSESTQLISVEAQLEDSLFTAENFNNYLKTNHQILALQRRESNNQMDSNAHVKNIVTAQTILRSKERDNEFCFRSASKQLELIPLVNPNNSYRLKIYPSGDGFVTEISFIILFKGEPLPKAEVKFWKRYANGKCKKSTLYTNKKGIVTISAISPGTFMLSCEILEKANNDESINWNNYSSTFTFQEKGNYFVKRRSGI